MRLYQRIIAGGLVLAGLAGLYGCDNRGNNSQKPAESKLEYFLDKGKLGNPQGRHHFQGIGVALGDMDNDGDLDMITAADDKIKYFENVGTRTNPDYSDRGIIGNPQGRHHYQNVGVSLADLDADGDLDIVTAVDDKIKYFENTLPQKNK